ncbi:MAG: HIT domain-containing protein [Candidatus Dormibacteria bacterium]
MTYVGGDPPNESACFLCEAITSSDDDGLLVVERRPLSITVLNRFPYNSGHVMVVPQRHVSDLRDLHDDESAALFSGCQRALSALGNALHPEGYNVGINLGKPAGGSVDHLHMHVVPRWAGDTNFMPALADTKVLPEHLEQTAQKLRDAYTV